MGKNGQWGKTASPLREISPEGNSCGTPHAALPVRASGRGIGTGLAVGVVVAPASPPAVVPLPHWQHRRYRLAQNHHLPSFVCQTVVCSANHPPPLTVFKTLTPNLCGN